MVESRVSVAHPRTDAAPPRASISIIAWAIAVSLAIVAVSILLNRVPRQLADANLQSDTAWYLAMVSHRWPPTGEHMGIHGVLAPFRYRILVPFLASLLPFGPVLSLALVTYASLAGAYVFTLLTSERLGLSKSASACGLLIACTFASPLYCFRNPLLTDAFGVLTVAAMTYACVVPSFAMFAAWGLVGIFGRETTALILPAWVLRHPRHTALLVVVAGVLLVVERLILYADVPDGSALLSILWIDVVERVQYPQRFVADLVVSWGWAFGFFAMGLLLRVRALKPALPAIFAAAACATITSIVATDVERYFAILLPAMAIAFAVVVREWMDRRNRVMLLALTGMTILQFFISWPNAIVDESTWKVTFALVPIAKIGALWMAIVAFALRRRLTEAVVHLRRLGSDTVVRTL